MVSLAVNIAAFRDGKILLTKREDFEVWCMPGGGVDDGESIAEAALRELHEETGFEGRLTRLVGLYSRPIWQDGTYILAVFAADIIRGRAAPQSGEVIDLGFFDPDHLPPNLALGHRQRISDAVSGGDGAVVRREKAEWPYRRPMSRDELYRVRDESGLPRDEFYLRYIGRLDAEGTELEVGGQI